MIFHILNGDALLSLFPEEIPGERISFRECLIDGPVQANSMEEFWGLRKDFIENSFPQTPELNYTDYSQKEIEKISQIPEKSQVYCWFEEDLFCQVNFWFTINFLQGKSLKVHLVLPSPESPYNFSFSGKPGLLESYQQAIPLDENTRQILEKLWKCFEEENVKTAQFLAQKTEFQRPFLGKAVEAWQNMIPQNGHLGKPKQVLLEIHSQNPAADFGSIFRDFQKRVPEYGFGDLQVLNMCHELGILKNNA